MKRFFLISFLMITMLINVGYTQEPQNVQDGKQKAIYDYIESSAFNKHETDYIYIEGLDGNVAGCLYNARVLSDWQTTVYGFELDDKLENEDFYFIRCFEIMINRLEDYFDYHKITTAIFKVSKESGAVEKYDWLGLGDNFSKD